MDENKNIQEQETENKNIQEQETEDTKKIVLTEKELQSMIDKRVSQALATQKKKLDEAYRLANMTAEEKREHEYNERLKALEAREAELAKRELMAELTKQLSEKNLPIESAEFLLGVDADTTNQNLKAFEKMFNKAVSARVAQCLGGNVPQASTNETSAITKEQFRKMSLAQQAQLYRENPELYNQLTAR